MIGLTQLQLCYYNEFNMEAFLCRIIDVFILGGVAMWNCSKRKKQLGILLTLWMSCGGGHSYLA